MPDLNVRHGHFENVEIVMQIAKSAALLALAAGTVVLGSGSAEAGVWSGVGGGPQINNCDSFSPGTARNPSSVTCLNFQKAFGRRGMSEQLNDCHATSLGNLLFLPIGEPFPLFGTSRPPIRSSSTVTCANISG
ncbi:hypothetical protein [Amycolatopsis taiwanensis]|nr:hypothetical protein [Amycolatopsis taiwanensis]